LGWPQAADEYLGHGASSTDPLDESQSVLEEYLREVWLTQ
jgi:hypothetical protein